MSIDVAILTPLKVEFLAVREHLKNVERYDVKNRICYVGTYKGIHHEYKILLYLAGAQNINMALVANDIAHAEQPSFMFTVGIAGGIKDATLGDVVVATKVYGYEAGKETDDGFKSRPDAPILDIELLEEARALDLEENWSNRLLKDSPEVYLGAIAAGEKVVASTKQIVYQRIKAHYNDAIAVEMEGIGFAKAMERFRDIRIMNIRGISDMLKDKAVVKEEITQPKAAKHAAAFAFELLYRLDFNRYNLKLKPVDKTVVVQDYSNDVKSLSKDEFVERMKGLILRDKFKNALEQVLQYTKGRDSELHNHAIMTSGQWNSLRREISQNLITDQDAKVSQNRIRRSLLYILDQLE